MLYYFFMVILIILTQDIFGDMKDFFWVPQKRRLVFVEDYYKLYRLNLHGDTAAHLANIYYLKKGLEAAERDFWWEHPVKSMGYGRYDWSNLPNKNKEGEEVYSQAYHAKYKELMKMKLSLLLTKSYIRFASRYDRENVYWFHSEDYEDLDYIKGKKRNKEHYLKRGFRIAFSLYQEAKKYWLKTKEYVKLIWEGEYTSQGSKQGILYRHIDLVGTDMDRMEDEVYKIYHQGDEEYKHQVKRYYRRENYPEFNYDKVLRERMLSLEKNQAKLEQFIKDIKKNIKKDIKK